VFSSILSGKTGLSSFANQTIQFCPSELIIYLFSSMYQWTWNIFEYVKLYVMWLVMLWTSFMNLNEFMFNYVLCMAKYTVNECLRWMMYVALSICWVWKNRMFRFPKPDCPVLAVLAYVSPNFKLLWSSCHVHHVLHVHTYKIIALIRCIDIGGAHMDFIKNVQNGISRPKLNFIQYAHI
jgi:hypothetical protein